MENDIEVTLDKVLDGYKFLYHDNGNKNSNYYSTKLSLTTHCSSCNTLHTRYVYLQQLIEYPNTVILDMCDKCCGDTITLVGNNKHWSKNGSSEKS